MAEPSPAEADFVNSQADVAARLGVDRHTVKEWMSQGAPKKTSAGYDVAAIKAWRELHKRSMVQEIGSEEYQLRMMQAKLLRAEGEALRAQSEGRLKEHEVRKTTSDIVHLDDVEMLLSMLFGESRRILMRIPKEMKTGYPKELQQAIDDDLNARLSIALRAIAGQFRRSVDLRE